MEKEMTGVYITGHPLAEYAEAVDALPDHIWEILQAAEEGRSVDGKTVTLAGILTERRTRTTRNNALIDVYKRQEQRSGIQLHGKHERAGA